MIAAVKTSGAITIYGFSMAINWDERKGSMNRDDSRRSFLIGSTEIDAFSTTKDLLIVSCAQCDNGVGYLRIYAADTKVLLKGIPGVNGYKYLAH